ncbi:putative tail protein [Bacillus phage 055SW001]|nr:putative tail protein [Bacillus phage 055SW001]
MPRRGEFINVEWTGLDELIDEYGRIEQAFMRVLEEEYRKYGLLLEEGGKALAPEDSGDLAASIRFSGIRMSGSGLEGDVGTNLVYALRRHEEPYRRGSYPKYERGSKFPNYYVNGRGATTRRKSWKGYPAGRKYLANAMKATEDYYNEMLERILERTINGRR